MGENAHLQEGRIPEHMLSSGADTGHQNQQQHRSIALCRDPSTRHLDGVKTNMDG